MRGEGLRGETGAVARAEGGIAAQAEAGGPRGAAPATTSPAVTLALGVLLAEATAAGTLTQTSAADARAAANLVIYNAAMLPGWPYASAFAKDGPTQDAKAALQALGAALDKMSPQEMAEYLARMGANYGLIELIRKQMGKEIDDTKHRLLGFLAILAQAVGDVLDSLKASVLLSEEEAAALKAARAGGSAQQGRRHLPL